MKREQMVAPDLETTKINDSLEQVARDITPLLAVTNNINDIDIMQPYELLHQLPRSTNNRKSAGPDNILERFLRGFAFALSKRV
jgi:hypothetical protein